MIRAHWLVCALWILFVALFAASAQGNQPSRDSLSHFVFIGGEELELHRRLLASDEFDGAQVIYSWRALEPREGEYDFTKIERDLALADSLNKKLFVQLQDRFFLPGNRNLPEYILTEPEYGGGLVRQMDNAGEGKPKGSGWVAAQWNSAVRARYQALLGALGKRFDGSIHGINLPETAIELLPDTAEKSGFSCDAYFQATMENLAAAKSAFTRSHVVQYVNFWPCEWNDSKGYMSRIFAFAVSEGVGIGGPDIIPYRRAQERNSYRFLEALGDELPLVAMAVQGPTLTYNNPQTGKKFTRAEFEDYAVNRLNVDIIFWSLRAPGC
ncbi:MAG: hypothetical protein AAFX04_04730 [Pseudomonadota bacterium]